MATPNLDSSQFQTPVKKRCSSPALSSPSSISTTSTNPKQRSITGSSSTNNNDETITTIKMEDGTDEVKVFSASTIKKMNPMMILMLMELKIDFHQSLKNRQVQIKPMH